jgi:hypothetical protein
MKNITFSSNIPETYVLNLADCLKYNISKNIIKSKSNILFLIILVLAENIFNMFVVNDNNKIINILKRLLFIYERLLKEKKFKYFHKYKVITEIMKKKQMQKFSLTLKKENIFNRLYDLKKRDKKLNELARKIEEEENKICSFSPKLKSKYNPIFNYYFYCSNSPTTRNNYLPNKFLLEASKTSIKCSTSSKCLSEKKKINKEFNIYQQKSNDNIKQYSIFNIPNYNSNNTDKTVIKNNFRKISHNINNTNSKINSRNKIQNTFNKSITDNLSLLFSSRLHKEEEKSELKKDKIKNKKKSQNSSSSTTNEKAPNYTTLSGTEHLSTLNLDIKSKNDKRKSYSNDYKEKNKIKKNTSTSINNQYNPFIKNTYNFNDISKDKFKNKNSRNSHKILNYYFESQEDFPSKKLSSQNSKSKTTTIIIDGLNTGNSTNRNNTIKSKEVDINFNVINDYIHDRKNRENEKKNSINNNSHITIQTISDSKLFDIASLYVRTDESLEKFRFLNKIGIKKVNQQKGILKLLNKNIKK